MPEHVLVAGPAWPPFPIPMGFDPGQASLGKMSTAEYLFPNLSSVATVQFNPSRLEFAVIPDDQTSFNHQLPPMAKDWQSLQEEIRQLYHVENKTLIEVMRVIKGRHGFQAW